MESHDRPRLERTWHIKRERDLQNAFGEVQHGVINTMLKYHHIPDHVIELVDGLYANFKTTITTRSYATPFLKIEKGVLQ